MAKITYTNKVALNENPEIADINKVTDDNMNEIKQVVNTNYNNTIQITNTEPTDSDNKIWIDTGEIAQAHTEITNEYSTSIGLGYSANYANNNFATKDYVQNDTVSYLHIFKKGHFVMVIGYLRVNADNKTITLPYKSKYKIEVPTVGFYDVSSNPQGYGYGKVEANSNSMVFKFSAAVTEASLNFVYYTDDED